MNEHESFSETVYEEQTRLAERELAAFLGAVTDLFGPEQARISEQDWLDESELMDELPVSVDRNWRAVTIAASVRLAKRLNTTGTHQPSTNTKVSPIPSSN